MAALVPVLGAPGSSRSAESRAVLIIALTAAGIAALSSAAPTGTEIWDDVLKAVLAVGVVVAGSKAPRWSVIAMASVATAASFLILWSLAAWVALATAIAAVLLRRRSRPIGALAAGLALQSLLRLPSAGFFGLQSILATVAILPVVVSGYRYGTGAARRAMRWSLSICSCAIAVVGLFGGLSLLNVRSDVNQGIAAAQRGLEAARVGDTVGVADALDDAEHAFSKASDGVSSPLARALRLVPIAAQHQRSIETAVTEGSVVAAQASAATRDADLRSLRLVAGSLDLETLSAMAPTLRATAASLEAASIAIDVARSPWLVPQIRRRIDEMLADLNEFRPEVELGADAAEVLPGMLGANGTRTYFVMFGVPAESRELGGFLGSWALLSFDDGRMQLGASGRIDELYDIAAGNDVAPGTVSDWFLEMARPTEFPQNLPSSPDISQVAAASNQVLAGTSDLPIDGFVYADGFALIDLLEVSGPVVIPFQEAPLTTDNAFEFFFEDQYRFDASDRTEVFDELAVVAEKVINRLTDQTLPGPAEIGRIMGPSARAGHLQVVTFDDEANDFLRSVRLLRDFGRDETSDFVGLVQTNGLSNKMDLYLHRDLEYRVAVEADGSLIATATITLRSVIPTDAPEFTLGLVPDVGDNRVLLSLYSPHVLTSLNVNGVSSEFRAASEFELGRYLVDVLVESSGEPVVIEYQLRGVLDPTEPYSLEVWHQPLVNTDDVTVSISGDDLDIQWSGPLFENLVLTGHEE